MNTLSNHTVFDPINLYFERQYGIVQNQILAIDKLNK